MRYVKSLSPDGDIKMSTLEEKIAESINALYDGAYEIWHREPENLRAGRVVYADGVDWDPGSGEGLYRRTIANAWVYIG